MRAGRRLLVVVPAVALIAGTTYWLTASDGPACGAAAATSPAAPAAVAPTTSTTTTLGAPVVETSFPTRQGEPLAEPAVITSRDGVLRTSFQVRDARVVVGGTTLAGMTYTGAFMGPTLKVAPGDTIRIDLRNDLCGPTNVHTHGVHASPIRLSDNVFRVMPANSGNEVDIHVPTSATPGTYWYHAHLHGSTEAQVTAGLAGALVVTGLEARLPTGLRDLPQHLVALRDVQRVGDAIKTTGIHSGDPTTRTVDGQVNPVIRARPGQAQLLRLANMSADIWYRVALDRSRMSVLAEDGNPVGAVTAASDLLMPPGKRFDVLVRWDTAGRYRLRTLEYQAGPEGDDYPDRVLATVAVAGVRVGTEPAFPNAMGPLPDLEHDVVARHRTVTLTENLDTHRFFVNGEQYSGGTPMFVAKLGTTEEWTIRNESGIDHPFHIHVNDFEVLSIDGKPAKAKSLVDTVRVPAHSSVVLRMRFADFVGKYVFHCHILAHEDNGMMAVLEITEDGRPASPAQLAAWEQSESATSTMGAM